MHRTGSALSRAPFSTWKISTSRACLVARRDYSQHWGKYNGKKHSGPSPLKRRTKGSEGLTPRQHILNEFATPSERPGEPSIYSQLFEKQTDNAAESSQLKDRSQPSSPNRQDNTGQSKGAGKAARSPDGDNTNGASIFQQLFPGEDAPRLSRHSDEATAEDGSHDGDPDRLYALSSNDTISLSIRNHFRNWAMEKGILPEGAPQVREPGSHSTVLVLSSVSPNLLESDFHRIASQGKHLEGWSNGLMKVVQVHDPATYQPLGQYFLFFHTRAFALDYMQRVKDLHALSKRALFSRPGQSDEGDLESPYPEKQSEDEEALRAFTLIPPSVDVDLTMRLWSSDFVREALAKSNIQDIFQASGSGPTTECKVVLALSRGGLSLHDLRLAIDEDGKSRNLAWKLRDSWDSIMPIEMLVSGEQEKARRIWGIEGVGEALSPEQENIPHKRKKLEEHETERFPRFLLTFANSTESRRFARNWHKRTVHDDVNRWTVEAETTALW